MKCTTCGVPAMLAILLILAGCGDARMDDELPAEGPAPVAGPTDSVTVVFTRGEEPTAVSRPLFHPGAELRTALEWLVNGPTEEERAGGVDSWFSDETAAVLRSAEVDAEGHATIDFRDLRLLIPNASTSAGSRMLLQELNGTVFQFPEIQSIEYRMEGSCALFWEWLQYECEVVIRQQ